MEFRKYIPQYSFFFTQIRRAVSSIRQVLSNKFVPNHLGFKHITRDAVISEHTRPLAKELFSPTFNQAILVLDGTYIYVQKSSVFLSKAVIQYAQTKVKNLR